MFFIVYVYFDLYATIHITTHVLELIALSIFLLTYMYGLAYTPVACCACSRFHRAWLEVVNIWLRSESLINKFLRLLGSAAAAATTTTLVDRTHCSRRWVGSGQITGVAKTAVGNICIYIYI